MTEQPSVACVCSHARAHHTKRDSVWAGLMADYKVVWGCGWTGCGCPNFVKATPPQSGPYEAGSGCG